jgi:hypothetical protein
MQYPAPAARAPTHARPSHPPAAPPQLLTHTQTQTPHHTHHSMHLIGWAAQLRSTGTHIKQETDSAPGCQQTLAQECWHVSSHRAQPAAKVRSPPPAQTTAPHSAQCDCSPPPLLLNARKCTRLLGAGRMPEGMHRPTTAAPHAHTGHKTSTTYSLCGYQPRTRTHTHTHTHTHTA